MRATTRLALAVLPLAVLLMAMDSFDSCGDDPSPGIQGTLDKVSGDAQTAGAGSPLPSQLWVKFGSTHPNSERPLGEVEIAWTVISGGGSITPATGTTDRNGYASAEWTMGPAGPQSATATVVGSRPVLSASFFATATGSTGGTCGNPRTYADDFSTEKTWLVTTAGDGSVTQSVLREPAAGNPGGFRRMTHAFTAATPDFVTIAVNHLYVEDGGYEPVEMGAVHHLRYHEDRIKVLPSGDARVGGAVLVRQGGIDHIAQLTGGVFGNEAWGGVTVDLTANDFAPPLNFASGNMEFGYQRSNSARFPIEVVHGIDNWRMDVCRQPQ